MLRDWNETGLWNRLSSEDARDVGQVRAVTELLMADLQHVLASGGTSPLGMTLHDAGHAFRVAERMVALIPSHTLDQLSHYELALLLLSAYGHDVGMVPETSMLSRYRAFLLGEGEPHLTDVQLTDWYRWYDGAGVTYDVPLPSSLPHRSVIADRLLTYFARDQHNAWSADWLKRHAPAKPLGDYDNWRSDLVRLCASHHRGFAELSQAPFAPRYVGTEGAIVNLRYLAIALRIADILEVDPERTPEVILRHRSIAPEHVDYWFKDHYLSIVIQVNHLIASARPPNAWIHKAVVETVDAIDAELRLCRRLATEVGVDRGPGGAHLPHAWPYEALVERDIREGGDYVFIDGAFRPDTDRLLELLAGVELYKTPFAAVRELIQNGFDTIREKVAWQRLGRPDMTPAQIRAIHETQLLELRVEGGEVPTLICRDTGLGMTQDILRDHFLVSGSGPRADSRELDRAAAHAGFRVGRTGRFGIGVLSYFMIADLLTVETRRAHEAHDAEAAGWRFESAGPGSFGQLASAPSLPAGTTAILRLRHDLWAEDFDGWVAALTAYLKDLFIRTPCPVRLCLPEGRTVEFPCGWGTHVEAPRLRFDESAPVTRTVTTSVEWIRDEGTLPHRLGTYSIAIPVFNLARGKSFVFIDTTERDGVIVVNAHGGGHTFEPRFSARIGWRGVAVGLETSRASDDEELAQIDTVFSIKAADRPTGRSNYFAQLYVNLEDDAAGRIGADRNWFVVSDLCLEGLRWVRNRAASVIAAKVEEYRTSPYAVLGFQRFGVDADDALDLYWLATEATDAADFRWKRVEFPTMLWQDVGDDASGCEFEGEQVRPSVRLLPLFQPDELGVTWTDTADPPDHVAALELNNFRRPAGVWTKAPRVTTRGVSEVKGSFPPQWDELAAVRFDGNYRGAIVWNPANRLVSAIGASEVEWYREWRHGLIRRSGGRSNIAPAGLNMREVAHEVLGDVLSDHARTAQWTVGLLIDGERALWNGLVACDPDFWARICECVRVDNEPGRPPRVMVWIERGLESRVDVLGETWQRYEPLRAWREMSDVLPAAGEEWTVRPADAGP